VGSVQGRDHREPEHRGHDRRLVPRCFGEKVLQGSPHAVARTALRERPRERSFPPEPAVDGRRRPEADPLRERVGVHRVRRQSGRVVVLVAAPRRPPDVVQEDDRVTVATRTRRHRAQLFERGPVVVVAIEQVGVGRWERPERCRAAVLQQPQSRSRRVHGTRRATGGGVDAGCGPVDPGEVVREMGRHRAALDADLHDGPDPDQLQRRHDHRGQHAEGVQQHLGVGNGRGHAGGTSSSTNRRYRVTSVR
jgi:hypothetical protein